MVFVTLLNQLYWVSGSTVGGLFGSMVHINTEGLDFAMTAMFVVIFMEQWIRDTDHTSSLVGLALSVVCLLIFGASNFIIPSMLSILVALTLLRPHLQTRGKVGLA
jgi:4-azaleucine resistance transporter AzlC